VVLQQAVVVPKFEVLSQHLPGEKMKTMKISVMIVGLWIEIELGTF
jgi:hypothetical protein